MAWTYAQLAAAVSALSPAPANNAAAATALNAQTTTLPPQDIAATAAQNAMLKTNDWPKVVLRSRQTPSNLGTASDMAIYAAIAATAMADAKTLIGTSDSTVWATFLASLQALQSVGDVSAAAVTAITALHTPSLPTWSPTITDQDVATALGH